MDRPQTRTDYKGKSYTNTQAVAMASIVPLDLDTKEFEDMIADMRANGFDPAHPIRIQKATGKIINGRRRELAAIIAGVEPIYVEEDVDDVEAVRIILRDDYYRRHSDPGVRAVVLAQGNKWLQENGGGLRRKEMEKAAGVSSNTMSKARVLVEKGTPELVQATLDGTIAVHNAHALTDLTAADQKEAVEKLRAEAGKGKGSGRRAGRGMANEAKGKKNGKKKPEAPAHVETNFSDQIVDAEGKAVPDGVRDAFGDTMLPALIGRLEELSNGLKAAAGEVQTKWTQYGEDFPFCHWEKALAGLKAAHKSAAESLTQVQAGVPHIVCPKCGGKECKWCQQTGYWPEHMADQRKQLGV